MEDLCIKGRPIFGVSRLASLIQADAPLEEVMIVVSSEDLFIKRPSTFGVIAMPELKLSNATMTFLPVVLS